ncbi:hypothetical protein HWV62_42012 [Athelia sp. TMB]|nr:hypothetical protein HWV62_42012 [Athelia sp. TMB]
MAAQYSDDDILAMQPVDAMRTLCRHRPDRFSAADGKIGLIHKQHLVTSPNMTYVPKIVWSTIADVRLRTDMRFGMDDATNWVQWHRLELPHLPAIPRRPSSNSPPKAKRYECMWWLPEPRHLTHSMANAQSGVGKLFSKQMGEMGRLKDELVREADDILQAVPTYVPGLGQALAQVRHTHTALTALSGEFLAKRLELGEFQRAWLELRGMINYYHWKRSRFERGHDTGPTTPEWCVGCFVDNFHIATEYWVMGVPVWLVRDKLEALRSGCYIAMPEVTSVSPSDIDDNFSTAPEPNFPLVSCASPRTAQHHYAQRDFSRVRTAGLTRTSNGLTVTALPSVDAGMRGNFATTLVSVADLRAHTAAPPAPSTVSSSQLVGPSRTQTHALPARHFPYPPTGAMRRRLAAKSAPKPHPKKTYVEEETERSAHVIPAWAKAMLSLDTKIPPGDQRPVTYTFPPPNLLESNADAERFRAYLYAWIRTREGWMRRMRRSAERPVALRAQAWRDLLFFRYGCPEPRDGTGKRLKEIQRELTPFGVVIDTQDGAIVFGSGERLCRAISRVEGPEDADCVEFNGKIFHLPQNLDDEALDIASYCSWELHTLGFRFDLARVDAELNTSAETAEDRERACARCWGEEDCDPAVIDTGDAYETNQGITSDTIEMRLPYLRALYALSRTWKGIQMPFGVARLDDPAIPASDAKALEDLLVAAVVQCAFKCLCRPIIAPRRACPVSSS